MRPIHWFHQSATYVNVNPLSTYVPALALALASGLGVTAFYNSYDMYRILKWTVSIIPAFNSVPSVLQTTPVVFSFTDTTEIASAIDYNDNTPPTSYNGVKTRDGVKITRGTRKHTRTLVPALQRQLYETDLTTGYEPAWKKWISTNDPLVPHFGLKIGIDNKGQVLTSYRIEGKFLVQFRMRKNPAADDDGAPNITKIPWIADEHQGDDPQPNYYDPTEWQTPP